MVSVTAAVGTSGSGKTTALEYLISNLGSEGYRIGLFVSKIRLNQVRARKKEKQLVNKGVT